MYRYQKLNSKLPEYAIPEHVVRLKTLPVRVGSGKLDRKKLPIPGQEHRVKLSRALKKSSSKRKRSDLDRKVLKIWQKVLNREDISYEDNFFDVLNTKYCYSNCSGQYYVLLHTSLLLFIVIIIVAFKTVRMMADSIMEGQDAFIMRKSDSEDVGLGEDYDAVLEDVMQICISLIKRTTLTHFAFSFQSLSLD